VSSPLVALLSLMIALALFVSDLGGLTIVTLE